MSNEAIYTVGCQRDPWHEEGEQAVFFFNWPISVFIAP